MEKAAFPAGSRSGSDTIARNLAGGRSWRGARRPAEVEAVEDVRSEVTLALRRLALSSQESDRSAARVRLFALLSDELRQVARRVLSRERPGHSLAPTELVHEVYLRVVDHDSLVPSSRANFLGVFTWRGGFDGEVENFARLELDGRCEIARADLGSLDVHHDCDLAADFF